MAGELILIVEDNEKNRKLIRDVLQVKGYQTLETETAEEGHNLAVKNHPALILMDIQLPGMDGITALKQLNWKTSIVDLLKLLSLDSSSFEARKGLATELGCPKEKMGDSAQMNMWFHKTVLQKLAENGGNIPKELL